MSDTRYLQWHGNQWRVQVKIKPSLWPVMGKKKLLVPLHTDSLANANRIKFEVVAKLKAEIRAAEKAITQIFADKSRGVAVRNGCTRTRPIAISPP